MAPKIGLVTFEPRASLGDHIPADGPTCLAFPNLFLGLGWKMSLHTAHYLLPGSLLSSLCPRPMWDSVGRGSQLPKGQEGAWVGSPLCQGYWCVTLDNSLCLSWPKFLQLGFVGGGWEYCLVIARGTRDPSYLYHLVKEVCFYPSSVCFFR